MLAIINAELVMRDHLIPDGYILIEDGLIKDYGEMFKADSFVGYEIIDAKGAYVGPGLVDIHCHAADDRRFVDDPIPAAQYMLKHGTTTILPAPSYSLTREKILSGIDLIQEAMKLPVGANIGGFYMEGPYLNPKYGSNRYNISFQGDADPDEYMEIIRRLGKDVKVWAIAPERGGIEKFMKDCKAVNPDVIFAVAHSEATPQQIEDLMPYGLCIGTHHTNATGTIINYPECRGVCVDEAVNYNREIYAEVISDSRGIHVDPYMQRLIRKIKGDDRIILITDCTCYDAPKPERGYEGVDDINFDMEGEISGSRVTLNGACRNMMIHTGASIVNVFNYASRTPARVVGFKDRGEIKRGLRADLILVDDKMNVKTVILQGKVVVENS